MLKQRLDNIFQHQWVQICFLLGFCIVLYFPNLNQWDLWNPDEPRYAQVAREMVSRGDWILMHYNDKIYPDKPPLFFWFIGLSSYVLQGFSSFSVRFIPALFGTLTVFLTFLLGKNLYSSRTGFLSGLILATSFKFAYLSTRANIDTTLTFFMTASLLCFFQWYRYVQDEAKDKIKVEAKVENRNRNWFIYGFYIAMALSTLTKGPVGFILLLLISWTYLVAQKDWKGIREMRLLTGMILFVVIVLAWYVPAVLKGGEDYLHVTLFQHSLSRFAKGSAHVHPIYYLLIHFPGDFLPWFFFLPAAIVYGYSRERIAKRKEFSFLVVWLVVTFLFFSLSKGKRDLYLLPLFPATSLMIGKLWDDFISRQVNPLRHAWISFPLCGLIGVILLAGGALPWVASVKFRSYLAYSLPISFLMIGSSLVLILLCRFKNYGAIFFLIVGMTGAGYFYTTRVILPLINPDKSTRFICQEITSRIRPGEKLAVYGGFETGPYNYYTGIVPILELEKKKTLFDFLGSTERVFCLLRYRDLEEIQTKEGWSKGHMISGRTKGPNEIVLITNR